MHVISHFAVHARNDCISIFSDSGDGFHSSNPIISRQCVLINQPLQYKFLEATRMQHASDFQCQNKSDRRNDQQITIVLKIFLSSLYNENKPIKRKVEIKIHNI